MPSILLRLWLKDDIIIPSLLSLAKNDTDPRGTKVGRVVSHDSPGRDPTNRESVSSTDITIQWRK